YSEFGLKLGKCNVGCLSAPLLPATDSTGWRWFARSALSHYPAFPSKEYLFRSVWIGSFVKMFEPWLGTVLGLS
ncbi:MAG TPA: hypothetical protein VHM94_07535, partial [Acidimicrobiia bacterium]|nr:hypothetical protein [Acidimicrobiia bacterium]